MEAIRVKLENIVIEDVEHFNQNDKTYIGINVHFKDGTPNKAYFLAKEDVPILITLIKAIQGTVPETKQKGILDI